VKKGKVTGAEEKRATGKRGDSRKEAAREVGGGGGGCTETEG